MVFIFLALQSSYGTCAVLLTDRNRFACQSRGGYCDEPNNGSQGITTADSRIHYVIGIGSALLICIILGNVVYFWRRAERIERELDELREQRIARARGKIEENDNLFV